MTAKVSRPLDLFLPMACQMVRIWIFSQNDWPLRIQNWSSGTGIWRKITERPNVRLPLSSTECTPIVIHPELSGCITTQIVRNTYMEVANFGAAIDTLINQDDRHTALSEISNRILGKILLHTMWYQALFFFRCGVTNVVWSTGQKSGTESQQCQKNDEITRKKIEQHFSFTALSDIVLNIWTPKFQAYTVSHVIFLSDFFCLSVRFLHLVHFSFPLLANALMLLAWTEQGDLFLEWLASELMELAMAMGNRHWKRELITQEEE